MGGDGREDVAAMKGGADGMLPEARLAGEDDRDVGQACGRQGPAAVIGREQVTAGRLDVQQGATGADAGIDDNDVDRFRRELGQTCGEEVGSVANVLGRDVVTEVEQAHGGVAPSSTPFRAAT